MYTQKSGNSQPELLRSLTSMDIGWKNMAGNVEIMSVHMHIYPENGPVLCGPVWLFFFSQSCKWSSWQ